MENSYKHYKYVDPEETKEEMKRVLVKGLGRKLTIQESRNIDWLSDCDYETRGVILDLFKELSQ